MGHYMKSLNQQLFQKVRDFGLEKCEEADILYDQGRHDRVMKEIFDLKRRWD